jgi:hypothetical protein
MENIKAGTPALYNDLKVVLALMKESDDRVRLLSTEWRMTQSNKEWDVDTGARKNNTGAIELAKAADGRGIHRFPNHGGRCHEPGRLVTPFPPVQLRVLADCPQASIGERATLAHSEELIKGNAKN